MIVRKHRLQRGWSQEQLAEFSGLSIRTIQRIERGQPMGLETQKSLAAVFELDFTELTRETPMNTQDISSNRQEAEEKAALEYVRDLKSFYVSLASYCVIIPFLFFVNLMTAPGYLWVLWPAAGWGVGLAFQAIMTFELFEFFGHGWEKKQVERRLGRKL